MSLETAVRNVHDFESLIGLLSRELRWDIEIGPIEDLTFEWSAGDLRVSESAARKLKDGSVFQLRPPSTIHSPPWGIFFVRFADDKIYRGVLRQVLRALVPKQRRQTQLPAWEHENLLFICATNDYQQFTFAHFKGMKPERAVLSSFGWKRGDTHIRTLSQFNLPALSWPQDESDSELWLRKWSAAFDVERVTDRFFTAYREVFENVEREVSRKISNQEQVRLYTQRLFNRLMFVYFIQKKGWLSYEGNHNYLRALFKAAEDNEESFLSGRLHWLFYYGLGNAGLIIDPRAKEFLASRIGEVPFLNGGLFDIEDSYDAQLSYEKKLEAADVEISNEAFGKILDLFEHFNFTIEESTPLDVQVAVDPEMLGKVFEELVTGRHETGSYYTPRPVVAFMCREALKHYLGRVESQAGIELFVDDGDTSQLTDPEAVLDFLKRVRVCDPACGSGAYLLGMLQELMRLRAALFKDYKIDFDKLYDRKREIIERNLYGVDKDKFAVQIACLRLWLSLAIESEIPRALPNLDFKIGCDDSLTAPPPHETQPDMFRVEKVRRYRDKKAQFLKCDDPDRKQKLRHEILTLRDEIAIALNHQPPAPNPQRVKLVQDRADQLSKEIKQLVRANDKTNAAVKQAQLKKLQRQLDSWQNLNGAMKTVGFDWAVEFAEIFMPQIGETWRIDDLHPLINDFKHQPTLVEEAKIEEGGFDIVVANPPYVRADAQFKHIQGETERQNAISEWKRFRAALLETGFYQTLYEKWDIYLPFLERAYQLLCKRGDMVFIISDAYNTAKYAHKSHHFFCERSTVERIDFCSDIPLFRAGVNNTVVHFSRSDPLTQHIPIRIRRWGEHPEKFDQNTESLPTGPQREFGVRLFRPEASLSQNVITGLPNLGSLCYVSVGMVIHADERKAHLAFRTSDLIADAPDKKHPKRFVEGKDLGKWLPRRIRYLEYGTSRAPRLFRRPTFRKLYEVPEKLISMDLSGGEPKVAYDEQQLFHNHSAWCFVPWHYLKGVRNKSIRKTAKYRKEVKSKQTRPLVFREELEGLSRQYDAKYLLAVMNSSFAKDWLLNKTRSKIRIYPDDWKLLPIPNASREEQQAVIQFVNQILAEIEAEGYPLSQNSQNRISDLEQEIDGLISRLYLSAATVAGLTGNQLETLEHEQTIN